MHAQKPGNEAMQGSYEVQSKVTLITLMVTVYIVLFKVISERPCKGLFTCHSICLHGDVTCYVYVHNSHLHAA